MAIKPDTSEFRFIAFSLISDYPLCHGASPYHTFEPAIAMMGRSGDEFLEIVDCEHHGVDVWDRREVVDTVRKRFTTVYRGGGMAPRLPALEIGLITGGFVRLTADLLYYGREVDRLKAELRQCGRWHETTIKRQVEAVEGVLRALLVFQLHLRGGR